MATQKTIVTNHMLDVGYAALEGINSMVDMVSEDEVRSALATVYRVMSAAAPVATVSTPDVGTAQTASAS